MTTLNIPATPLNIQATKVNFHDGILKEGKNVGAVCIVIDFTIDGDKWFNHGIYSGNALNDVETIKAVLLDVGATEQRAEQYFTIAYSTPNEPTVSPVKLIKYQATTGDLVYKFEAVDSFNARQWVTDNLDVNNDMSWDITILEKEIFGYKNTSSSAGNPTHYIINPLDVVKAFVWFSSLGNPSYGLHLEDGSTYLIIDNYGVMNHLNHLSRIDVDRKKDLI